MDYVTQTPRTRLLAVSLPCPLCYLLTDMSLQNSSETALPLPSRPNTSVKRKKPLVWPINDSVPGVDTPPAAKCASSTRENGICCKELIGDERTLVDPDIVRDV